MAKKKVTKADLDKTLRELGFKEGDDLPSAKSQSNESSTNDEGDGGEGDGEGEGNGGNHPTKKPGG